jgi:hypothetical protein
VSGIRPVLTLVWWPSAGGWPNPSAAPGSRTRPELKWRPRPGRHSCRPGIRSGLRPLGWPGRSHGGQPPGRRTGRLASAEVAAAPKSRVPIPAAGRSSVLDEREAPSVLQPQLRNHARAENLDAARLDLAPAPSGVRVPSHTSAPISAWRRERQRCPLGSTRGHRRRRTT